MLITLKNTLSGLLDLSPLKDSSGHNIVFKAGETKQIPKTDLDNPLVKRVMASGWLVAVGDVPAPVVAPPAPAPAPAVVVAPVEPPAPPAPPVKTAAEDLAEAE